MLQIPSPPALRLRPVETVPDLLPQNTCPLSSSSQCRGLVKCRNANSIKGYYSQGYSYEVLKAIAARVQLRDSPKSTQVCRAPGIQWQAYLNHTGAIFWQMWALFKTVFSQLILHWNHAINGSCVLRETPNGLVDHKIIGNVTIRLWHEQFSSKTTSGLNSKVCGSHEFLPFCSLLEHAFKDH